MVFQILFILLNVAPAKKMILQAQTTDISKNKEL
jgi:hypothetical protein